MIVGEIRSERMRIGTELILTVVRYERMGESS